MRKREKKICKECNIFELRPKTRKCKICKSKRGGFNKCNNCHKQFKTNRPSRTLCYICCPLGYNIVYERIRLGILKQNAN